MSFSQYHITSYPRHIRHMFFIDEKYPISELWDIINNNLCLWGGRYNAIIPIFNGVLTNEYKLLCENCDPDFIYYSEAIDIELIQKIGSFKTARFNLLSPNVSIEGIGAINLLNLFNGLKVASLSNLQIIKHPLLDFLKLNFGLVKQDLQWQAELFKKQNGIVIDKDDINFVIKILAKNDPVRISELSNINTNAMKFMSDELQFGSDSFEIVISKDNSYMDDILYFWNRRLYECRGVLYITLAEFAILINDEYFDDLLSRIYFGKVIEVVSLSVDSTTIGGLISDLNRKTRGVEIKFKSIAKFPFSISKLVKSNFSHESKQSQILVSDKTLYNIPNLSFDYFNGQFISDISITKITEEKTEDILYPEQLNSQFVIPEHKGRINNKGNLSVVFNSKKLEKECAIHLIPFNNITQNILISPWINGTTKKTVVAKRLINSTGTKLAAFIRLFNNDFNLIDDFLSDKFWMDIFSELCVSKKEVGNCITSKEVFDKCIEKLSINGIKLTSVSDSLFNEENLSIGLKYTISELCSLKVLLKGFKMKCPECTSQFWYHINEVGEKVKCNGCLSSFDLPFEPKFAYKLNDLVKNNFFMPDKMQMDGNLTVIKTLSYLSKSGRHSFNFSPQLDLYKYNQSTPFTDLDIFCVSDGKLIIGESKTSSLEFKSENNKCLRNLVEISKDIRPSIIVLSCYQDNNRGLEKAMRSLHRLFNNWEHTPEIKLLELQNISYDNFESYRYFYHL